MSRPLVTVTIEGPQGSGKTTAVEALRKSGLFEVYKEHDVSQTKTRVLLRLKAKPGEVLR